MIEKPSQRSARCNFERQLEVVGAGLLKQPLMVEVL